MLHVSSAMSAEAGGPPAVCAGLAGALAARGHAVTVATLEDGGTPLPVADAVEVKRFPADNAGGYRASKPLRAWLERETRNFDIVHLHSIWQQPTYAAAKAARRARKPYVSLLHGMLDQYAVRHRSSWKKRLYWMLRERGVQAGAAAIHCLNRAEIRRAVPWIATMPKFVVGNGISSAEVAAMPARGAFRKAHPEVGERPLALFLSRIHPKKGLERLIPAWHGFLAQVPEGRLVIAGTGEAEYVSLIDRLVQSAGLEGKVLMVGQLMGARKWEALVDADLFVLPSHQEGFSVAITEALAAECVPVVTEECNFDELREAGCGEVLAGADMKKFVAAAAALIANPERRLEMGARGRALVQRQFTWEKIAEQIEQVYRHAIAGKAFAPDGGAVWR